MPRLSPRGGPLRSNKAAPLRSRFVDALLPSSGSSPGMQIRGQLPAGSRITISVALGGALGVALLTYALNGLAVDTLLAVGSVALAGPLLGAALEPQAGVYVLGDTYILQVAP